MHFDFLPNVIHNEDAIRELERQENLRIRRWMMRVLIALPSIAALAWFLFHFR